jgi:two-component system, OmpR family, KDP operon response regulator KdpE
MNKGEQLVLVIEDERPIRRFLHTSLTQNGYAVVEATTGQEGINLAATRYPDLIILDLGLPDIDGLEVTRRLREWLSTPIIVLSAREKEADKISALDLGADDYLTKPFSVQELMARMRTAFRHVLREIEGIEDAIFTTGDLRVDLAHRQVFLKDREMHLAPIEYKLLMTFVHYAGRVVTHEQLLKEVWGVEYLQEKHYLRVYMRQLRHKIEDDPTMPRYFVTEPGVGYRLRLE